MYQQPKTVKTIYHFFSIVVTADLLPPYKVSASLSRWDTVGRCRRRQQVGADGSVLKHVSTRHLPDTGAAEPRLPAPLKSGGIHNSVQEQERV